MVTYKAVRAEVDNSVVEFNLRNSKDDARLSVSINGVMCEFPTTVAGKDDVAATIRALKEAVMGL